MLSIIENIAFLCLWLIFAILWFRVFKGLRPERLFKQGSVLEIRLFYILSVFTISFINAYAFMYLFNLLKINF